MFIVSSVGTTFHSTESISILGPEKFENIQWKPENRPYRLCTVYLKVRNFYKKENSALFLKPRTQ